MQNEFQGTATYDLLYRTNMGLEEFLNKFTPDNIVDMKIHATLSDGSKHIIQVCEIVKAVLNSFTVNGDEVVMEDLTEKEKITKTGSVIQLAI